MITNCIVPKTALLFYYHKLSCSVLHTIKLETVNSILQGVMDSVAKISIQFVLGSHYRYPWPDAIQIKGSVCHSNGMDLVA